MYLLLTNSLELHISDKGMRIGSQNIATLHWFSFQKMAGNQNMDLLESICPKRLKRQELLQK
jgi:hypothetical protein